MPILLLLSKIWLIDLFSETSLSGFILVKICQLAVAWQDLATWLLLSKTSNWLLSSKTQQTSCCLVGFDQMAFAKQNSAKLLLLSNTANSLLLSKTKLTGSEFSATYLIVDRVGNSTPGPVDCFILIKNVE